MSELITLETIQPIEVFTNGGLEPLLAKVEAEVRKFQPDMTSEAGRKEIASVAYKVAKSKTALDNLGKDLVADWKKKSSLVDAERRKAWDRLEALQHEVRKPLTDWENAEKSRVDTLKTRMQDLTNCGKFLTTPDKAMIEAEILKANSLYQFNWEEFATMAESEYNTIKSALDAKLAERVKYDAEQAELEKLRKEAAEREQKEREERIAREAAEKARLEAESKAEKEKQEAAAKAQAEIQKAEAERKAAQEAKEKAERDAIEAAKKAKEAAEKAEAEKKALEEKLANDAAEKAKKEASVNNLMATFTYSETIVINWAKSHNIAVGLTEVRDLLVKLGICQEGKAA